MIIWRSFDWRFENSYGPLPYGQVLCWTYGYLTSIEVHYAISSTAEFLFFRLLSSMLSSMLLSMSTLSLRLKRKRSLMDCWCLRTKHFFLLSSSSFFFLFFLFLFSILLKDHFHSCITRWIASGRLGCPIRFWSPQVETIRSKSWMNFLMN